MNAPDPHRPSLLQRLFRRDVAQQEDDAADMGTAFGLDYALDEPAHAAQSLAAGRPQAVTEPSRPARWWR